MFILAQVSGSLDRKLILSDLLGLVFQVIPDFKLRANTFGSSMLLISGALSIDEWVNFISIAAFTLDAMV